MANGYRNALVQQIKDAGQELINRAESMVHPENDLITDFSIVIHFEQHEVPTINYTTSVVNKVACDRVIYQKGESNVSKISRRKCQDFLPKVLSFSFRLCYTISATQSNMFKSFRENCFGKKCFLSLLISFVPLRLD